MQLTDPQLEFLAERHLGSLTTIRRDGTPHVVAIAFTYLPDDGTVQIITSEGTQKVLNVDSTGRAVVCQVDGRRWLSLEGPAIVKRDTVSVQRAETAFESRYRPPSENPDRVAIEVSVDRVLGPKG